MAINHLGNEQHSFGPDELKVLATVFDTALLDLGLKRTDPAALWLAKRMMALAQGGERDPTRLREGTINRYRSAPQRSAPTQPS
jgi:hypothetical protein